mgnify:CR=1 FL=1
MIQQSKIYVAGHLGMVGSAIVQTLKARGNNNIVTRSHSELDLTIQSQVKEFFEIEKPDQVLDMHKWHHKMHASCAFYRSGFSSAVAVIVDGAGTFIPMNISGEDIMTWELFQYLHTNP